MFGHDWMRSHLFGCVCMTLCSDAFGLFRNFWKLFKIFVCKICFRNFSKAFAELEAKWPQNQLLLRSSASNFAWDTTPDQNPDKKSIWSCCSRFGVSTWCTCASLGYQGQSGVPGPVWGANASLGRQRQSGMTVQVSGARASLRCQGQCAMPPLVWGAKAHLGCQGQCEVDAAPGMLPSYLCNSMCCSMLLQSWKQQGVQ